jgi:hypothetical protein
MRRSNSRSSSSMSTASTPPVPASSLPSSYTRPRPVPFLLPFCPVVCCY